MTATEEAVEQALELLRGRTTAEAATLEMLEAQFDLGIAWPHFRPGCGGLGVSVTESRDIRDRLRDEGLPTTPASFVGLHQASALIHDFGTPDQQDRFLRRIFTGEDQWCQLFSEPGAGSDLANVATRAYWDRDGDCWHFDGQKVWTSNARHASHAVLLARTDPAEVKHRGMTMFVLDMRQPGVEIRPLRQIDGGARFSEVFLSGARTPDELRLGDPGQGWALALHILTTERAGASELFDRPVGELVGAWQRRRNLCAESLRDDVIRLWIQARVNALSAQRRSVTNDQAESARLGSIAKVAASERAQRHAELLALLLGPEAVTAADYEEAFDEDVNPRSAAAKDFSQLSPHRFIIRTRAMSIEGGTNEIARNIVAERVLGLPADVRVDKGRPWQELDRS